jgi:hypothetical protein
MAEGDEAEVMIRSNDGAVMKSKVKKESTVNRPYQASAGLRDPSPLIRTQACIEPLRLASSACMIRAMHRSSS